MIRKILITHSIHRGNPRFKFPIGRGAVRYGFWDSIPEALSSNYDVEYIEISLLKKEDICKYDLFFILFDDIYSPFDVIDEMYTQDKKIFLIWSGCPFMPEMSTLYERRSRLYKRILYPDVILGYTEKSGYIENFTSPNTILSEIVPPIDFDWMYSTYKDIGFDSYQDDFAVMPHVIECHEGNNWSNSLLSMKIMNRLGYISGYHTRGCFSEDDVKNYFNSNGRISLSEELEKSGVNFKFFPFLKHHEYVIHLSKCKLMFELRNYESSASTAIPLALFAKLPSMGSPSWYQNLLFPDLVINHYDFDLIETLNEKLKGSFRKEVIDKGFELAKSIDLDVISDKLSELVESL